jgi:anaerobic selenocysteine-containing dehydrogenase
MQIRRRDFIKLVGGVSGAALLGVVGLDEIIDVPDKLIEAVQNGPGIETWKNTMCRLCPGGCGVSVRLVDGVPVSIKGNPVYPVNQGGMCPLGFAGLQVLYHPERLKGPMRRVGLHGRGTWEPISWDDALTEVVSELTTLRSEGKAHQVAFLGSDESDVMGDHFARFMTAYGSPNYYRFSSQTNDAVPFLLTQGRSRIPAYDFLNTQFVLSLGANFLEEEHAPVYYTKLYSKLRDQASGPRAQLVCVDSRMTLTAANADHWIPIRPGTYGALALGIAYVLIREEMIDAEFVAEHTFGFEDSVDRGGRQRMGFKTLVLGGYYPERVEEITGVPGETIIELARDLGNTRPSLVIAGSSVSDHSGGTYASSAIHSLNALLGNLEQDGGVILADTPPLKELPSYTQDADERASMNQRRVADSRNQRFPVAEFSIQSFAENILSGEPYPISVLFLYGGNPLFCALNHHQLSEALKRIPLIVSFDSFTNETSEYADVILPDHSFLEKWDAVSNTKSVMFTHVGVQQPVVEPFHDTRHTADVLTDVAQRLGGSVGRALSIESFENVLRDRLVGVFDSGRGAVVSEGVQRSWLEFLQQRGWQIGRYSSFDQFWRLLVQNGGWWDPIRPERSWEEVFATPSGRFEFYSQILEESIQGLVSDADNGAGGFDLERVLTELGISSRGESVYLPHYEPSLEQDDGLPLYLTTFQTLANRDGHAANLPMMQEMFGQSVRRYWRTWAEMHPETASSAGIRDGDWIWIESDVGSIRVQAVVHPGIALNVVSVPFGLGHTSYGRYASGYGVNPNTIIRDEYDRISGKPALDSTRVRITVAA